MSFVVRILYVAFLYTHESSYLDKGIKLWLVKALLSHRFKITFRVRSK